MKKLLLCLALFWSLQINTVMATAFNEELALISALPNKEAQNILLSRKSLSLEAELALVNLLNGYKMDLAKKILQNVGQKRALYLQTQMALLEKLSNPQARKSRPAFRVLQSTKFHKETKEKLIELLSHSPTQKLAKELLLGSDLKLSVPMQNQLVSYLSLDNQTLKDTATDILREIGGQGQLSPTVQKHLITEFVFDPVEEEKRRLGMEILKPFRDWSASSSPGVQKLSSTASQALRQLANSAQFAINPQLASFIRPYRRPNSARPSSSPCPRAFS